MSQMIHKLRRALVIALSLGLLVVVLGSLPVAAATTVTPNNPDGWAAANVAGSATVGITTDQPRDGLGSLKFTSPSNSGKADFEKTWTDSSRTLASLSNVSFEYYRDSSSTVAVHFSPVLRLYFYQDNGAAGPSAEDHFGYLIWEGIYNGIPTAPTNMWESEDLTSQNFWMRYVGGPNNTGGCNRNIENYNVTLSDWLTNNPQGQPSNCTAPDLSTNTYITGMNVGIGSGWTGTFLGYVDNVVLQFGASDEVSANFEPTPLCTTVCYADAVNGSDLNGGTSPTDAKKTIQAAIDNVSANGQVRVLPGNYSETATGRDVLGVGNYQFGLFFEETAKDGVTLMGVTAADVEITDPALTEAVITTNATNNFGYSGIFVEADNVTITGLEIGPNTPSDNKTIEVIGDAFTFKNSFMNVPVGGSLYFGDWRFTTATPPVDGESYMLTYEVDNNIFSDGTSVDITSGAGYSGATADKKITNNVFEFSLAQYTASGNTSWPTISFTGHTTDVPWFVHPMTGATITGNTFTNTAPGGIHIRARGIPDDSTFDWESYWDDNIFNKSVIVGPDLFNDVRSYTYTSGAYTMLDNREIAATIQTSIDKIAQAGDTVLVGPGSYPESPKINKSLTLVSDDGRDTTFIELQPGSQSHSMYITGEEVTVDGFTIVGIDAVCPPPPRASVNIYLSRDPDNVVIKNNRIQVGDRGSCGTLDDGIGLLTLYSSSAAAEINSLTVENNIFEPLSTTGHRAFYINPSVSDYIFRNNQINGTFNAVSLSEAMDSLIEGNTITGSGASAGIGLWGQKGPGVWGTGTIRGNTITDTANAISLYDADDVTVTKNILTDNGTGVRVLKVVPAKVNDPTTVHINRNHISGNTTIGIDNQLDPNTYGVDIDGICNWWGNASGPGAVASGSGDLVSALVEYDPWLLSSNLDGPCPFEAVINLTPSYLVTRVEEGKMSGEGSKACYWITLASEPDGDVVIDIDAGPEVNVDKTSVTLNASNWNSMLINGSNFVCVRAIDDKIDEPDDTICGDKSADMTSDSGAPYSQECGDHLDLIEHQVNDTLTTDTLYSSLTSWSNQTLTELSNNGRPGENYLEVMVVDNDVAEVRITESFAITDLDESGSPVGKSCYWLTLGTQPLNPVTVTISPDGTEVATDKTSVILDASNWNVIDAGLSDKSNMVCVTPINEDVTDPKNEQCSTNSNEMLGQPGSGSEKCGTHLGSIAHSVSSADPKYNPAPFSNINGPDFDSDQSTIEVLIRDDDIPDVRTSPKTLNLQEGKQATLSVSLASKPKANVFVSSALIDEELVFKPTNWNVPQEIIVDAPTVAGSSPETLRFEYTVRSDDANFQDLVSQPVEVTVIPKDVPGVLLSITSARVSEAGQTSTYSLALTSKPAANVEVKLSTDGQLTLSAATLQFTPNNWNLPQQVTVQAVNDNVAESQTHQGRIYHTVASADGEYQGLAISDIVVDITDNDVAAVMASRKTLAVSEDGQQEATYDLVLQSQPSAPVIVRIDGGGQVTATPSTVTFTPADWNVPQAVQVRAINDDVDEGVTHMTSLTHKSESDDPFYNGYEPTLSMTVADDDIAGVRLSRSTISMAMGQSGTYTMVLTSRPTSAVVIDFVPQGDMTVSSASCANVDNEEDNGCVLFTPDNWNVPQTMTVQANGKGSISHVITSTDSIYQWMNVNSVMVNTSFMLFLPMSQGQ